MNYKDMGEKIRKARKAAGMTQAQLAEAAEISPAFIGHIERGTRIASLETLVNLCNTLNLAPGYLLSASLTAGLPAALRDHPEDEREKILHLLRLAEQVIHENYT